MPGPHTRYRDKPQVSLGHLTRIADESHHRSAVFIARCPPRIPPAFKSVCWRVGVLLTIHAHDKTLGCHIFCYRPGPSSAPHPATYTHTLSLSFLPFHSYIDRTGETATSMRLPARTLLSSSRYCQPTISPSWSSTTIRNNTLLGSTTKTSTAVASRSASRRGFTSTNSTNMAGTDKVKPAARVAGNRQDVW